MQLHYPCNPHSLEKLSTFLSLSSYLFDAIDRLQAEVSDIPNDLADFLEEADIEFIHSDFPKVLTSISNGTERINSLILSLKVFSRLQESQIKQTNLNEGLDSALLLLGHRLKSQPKRPEVSVVRRYADLPKVECFSSQINQVFMNIMNNALDAIDERWEKTPNTWKPTLTVESKLFQDFIQIQITNNGLPIPENAQAKVFDPFFTTKKVGKGVGLGMSVSYEIICEKHHGQITFISPVTDDMGAKFSLEIPLRRLKSAPDYTIRNGWLAS